MIIGPLLRSLALSLLMTELFELAAAFLLGFRKKHDLLLVFLVNIITNPPVVMSLNGIYLFTGAYPAWYWIALIEAAAVLAEYLLYRRCLERRKIPPFLLSLVLNCISYFGGLICEKVF